MYSSEELVTAYFLIYMCDNYFINRPSPLCIKFSTLTFVCMADYYYIPLPILILHLPICLTEMIITRLHSIPRHAPNIRVRDVHDLVRL